MSYTSTTNLSLRKDNGDEKIVDMRPHLNTNLDVIDQAYGDLNSRYRGQQTWGGLKGAATWGELKGNDVSTASAQTTNLQLIKPGYDSEVDVDVFNDNMDIIDSSIKTLQDSVAKQHSFTVTLSTTKYGSFYYADYNYAAITTMDKIVGVFVSGTPANHFGNVQVMTSTALRIWGDVSGSNINCVLVYI